MRKGIPVVICVFCFAFGSVSAQSENPDYYQPYVMPVSFAGLYVTIGFGTLAGSGLPEPETRTFTTMSQMLLGTCKPRFQSMISVEAGWSFAKTRVASLEQRSFGVTGDISFKALKAPFDVTGVSDDDITGSYSEGLSSVALGGGIYANYRFLRRHFIRVGFKLYPTFQMVPDVFVRIGTSGLVDEPNSSQSVITASGKSPLQNGPTGEYTARETTIFALQHAYTADVILFKKLMAGITYTQAAIDNDYTYDNRRINSSGLPEVTSKTFKANLNYSHVSLRIGFYFSRGYETGS